MNTLNLGDELLDPKANRVVMKVTNPTLTMGRVSVLEANAETERWIVYEELREQIANGALEVLRPGHPKIPVFIDRNDRLTCERKVPRQSKPGAKEDSYLSSLALATRVVRTLKEYATRHKVSTYVAYAAVRKTFTYECQDWTFPSQSTVYRLLERDRCNAPLVTPNDLKGNRKERHCAETVDLICTLAQDAFFKQGSRWTLNALSDLCRRSARALGLIDATTPLSKKFVRKVIVTKLDGMPETKRLLSNERAAKASVAKYRIRVEGVLGRVEQDSVHLPFAVMTPDGVSTDVWLTHGLDCGCSYVVGWHLRIGAPNESDGLRCIESSMFSKMVAFKYFNVEDATDLYGVPALLVLDNGAEGKGERFRRLAELGIDVDRLQSHQPQKKPFIERLNRSLKVALEVLPGSTRMNGKDGARDPVAQKDKLMDLQELERWIVRWYFHKWADTVLERFVDEDVFEDRALGVTPSERYKNIVERQGCPLPLPPNQSEWTRIKYNAVSRTLSIKTGITYETFEFRGENLPRLLERFGEQPVDVLTDPEDFRRVYVVDGDELVELCNQSASETTPAYSFSQAKEMKASHNALHPETERSAAFTLAIQERAMESSKRPGTPKKAPNREQKKAVVAKTRDREAVERAAQYPLLPPKPVGLGLGAPSVLTLDDVPTLPRRDRKTGALR